MYITKDGKVLDNDEVATVFSDMGLEEYFVVRVLRENKGSVSKELMAEFELDGFPSDAQIMYCIVKGGGNIADVRRRYRLSENGVRPSEH